MSVHVPGFAVHPALDIFPAMDSATFAALVLDIQEHGQLEPCVVWKGLLLDGRHRILACRQIGIEPEIVEIELEEGEYTPHGPFDPVLRIVSANLYRQHLDGHVVEQLRRGNR